MHDGDQLRVGRSRPAELVFEDRSLSRLHVEFRNVDGNIWVRDLDSTNGVHVGERRVFEELMLPGKHFRIGAVRVSLNAPSQERPQLVSVDEWRQAVLRERIRSIPSGQSFTVALVHCLGANAHVQGALTVMEEVAGPLERMCVYSAKSALLLLPNEDAASANARLTSALRQHEGLRVGLAVFPSDASTVDELIGAARRSLRGSTAEAPVARMSSGANEPEAIVASSSMVALYAMVKRIAPSRLSVLVRGETGAGKELIARAIHDQSGARSQGPLKSVNCGALSDSILQSVLFGHVKGAFTGAETDRAGLFESATGGTLFLDEVGELSQGAQAALLRVLETGRVVRVGDTREIAVDVRIVSATHRDLHACAEEGSFRSDLLYRLDGVSLELPPLRERRDEILPLSAHFMTLAGRELTITDAARALLLGHSWPGNVRELRNVIERACVVAEGETLLPEDLPGALKKRPAATAATGPVDTGEAFKDQIASFEQTLLLQALKEAGGNQTQAAKRLQMPLRTLVYKMKKYGIRKNFDSE